MMFKRKLYDKMLVWKEMSCGRTALMIDGARRVGKSTIAEEFAKREYGNHLIIDFAIANDDIKSCFRDDIGDLDVFFRNLFVFSGTRKLPERNSVIIFDEVQRFPLARQAIKYLVKDGRYDYIETGSLISILKKSKDIVIPSEEEKIKMFPMDFEEFLWATGDLVSSEVIREAFEKQHQLGDRIHRNLIKKFRAYIAVGGMPQAVDAFVRGETYDRIDRIKRNILALYEEDLKKADEENGIHSSVIFKTIPQQLTNNNSLFRFSKLGKNARYINYVNSMKMINESMIGNYCRNVSNPELTLELFAEDEKFKLFLGDTGLLITQILTSSEHTDNDLYRKIISGKFGTNLGMVFENIVAQMLRASGHILFFHQFKCTAKGNAVEKQYDIDFLIVRNSHICPVEVKSSNYSRHTSLDVFLEKYKVKCPERYIIYTKDYKKEEGVTFIPAYMTMCL